MDRLKYFMNWLKAFFSEHIILRKLADPYKFILISRDTPPPGKQKGQNPLFSCGPLGLVYASPAPLPGPVPDYPHLPQI